MSPLTDRDVPVHLRAQGTPTAYGVGVKRSDLALAALASAAVPGMQPVAVAAVGPADDGTDPDHQQALVEDTTGRRWWVRAPLTAVAGAAMQRNDELVRQLARHLPFKVPAPVGYAALGPVGHAAVYPFVEGSPIDLGRLPAGPGLASAVGRAVAAVHNVPRGVFEEQDVPVFDAAGCRQRLTAEVDRAAETGRVPTGLLARWEAAFDAAPLWQFATTPVHGAFRGTSVLVVFGDEDDASSGRVVAVTGWEEAQIADPAVDLAHTCALASPQAWESVLDSYALARAQRPDPYLHARARLISETRLLRGLAVAVAEGREDEVRRKVEVLRRTDRLTEEDDSLVPFTARSSGATTQGGPSTDHHVDTPGREVSPEEPAGEELDLAGGGGQAHLLAGGDDPGSAAEVAAEPGPDPTMEVAYPESPAPEGEDAPSADRPEQDAGDHGSSPAGDQPEDGAGLGDEDEDLDDQQRLHELYGMPSPDPDTTQALPTERPDGEDGPPEQDVATGTTEDDEGDPPVDATPRGT